MRESECVCVYAYIHIASDVIESEFYKSKTCLFPQVMTLGGLFIFFGVCGGVGDGKLKEPSVEPSCLVYSIIST